jgi:phage terminase small subunit
MAGRRSTPTRLKLLNGSAEHDPQRLNPDEPQPDVLTVLPEPPERLSAPARRAWDRLAHQAIKMRVLTEADLDMLLMGCKAFAEYLHADRATDRGDAWRRYVYALKEFGGSPSSRVKLHAAPKPNDSRMAGLLTPRRRTG